MILYPPLPESVPSPLTSNPSIQSLIPHAGPDTTAIVRQVGGIRVETATDIEQTFVLNHRGTKIYGKPVPGEVAISCAGHLPLTITEEFAAAKTLPYEFARLLAGVCHITDPNHLSLLYMALSDLGMESIASTFTEQGISVTELVPGMQRIRKRHCSCLITR
jgi:hypothetical protein